MEQKNNFKKIIDWDRVALLLGIAIVGAVITISGDFLMGWATKDMSLKGIERELSQFHSVSDDRMFMSAIVGLIGVPMGIAGHFAIYNTLKPYSQKYAKLYVIGNFGFLTFGGAGVHVSSVGLAYFYKHMSLANPKAALVHSTKIAMYILVPLYVVVAICWVIMVYAQFMAVIKGRSPYPRSCLVFSMAVGTVMISLTGLAGNHAIVNALMVGAFSFGNIWTLSGHLILLPKAKQKYESDLLAIDKKSNSKEVLANDVGIDIR